MVKLNNSLIFVTLVHAGMCWHKLSTNAPGHTDVSCVDQSVSNKGFQYKKWMVSHPPLLMLLICHNHNHQLSVLSCLDWRWKTDGSQVSETQNNSNSKGKCTLKAKGSETNGRDETTGKMVQAKSWSSIEKTEDRDDESTIDLETWRSQLQQAVTSAQKPVLVAASKNPLARDKAHEMDHITPVLRSLHWLPVSQRVVLPLHIRAAWSLGVSPLLLVLLMVLSPPSRLSQPIFMLLSTLLPVLLLSF